MKKLCRVTAPLVAVALVGVVLALTPPAVNAHGGNGLSLRVSHSGKCMDLKQASQSNGAKVQQYQCHGGNNQRFEIVHHPDAYHSLKFLHSGKCLTAIGSANGTQFEQQTCTYSDAQKFTLGAYGSPSYRMQNKGNGKCIDVQNGSHSNSVPVVQMSCDIYSSSQLWAARHHSLFQYRLNGGPVGRYYYFLPTNPSAYNAPVDNAVTSWNNATSSVSFTETTNYYDSVADFYVLNAGNLGWEGGMAPYLYGNILATDCDDWDDFCLPNSDWDYARLVLNSYYLDGVSSQWKQAVAGHEFGHGAPALWHTGFPPYPFPCPCTFDDQLLYGSAGAAYIRYGTYAPKWNDVFNAGVAY